MAWIETEMTDTWTIDLSIAKNTDKKVWTRQLFAARTGTLIEREKRVKSSAEVISGFVRSSLDQAFFSSPVENDANRSGGEAGGKGFWNTRIEGQLDSHYWFSCLLVNTSFY